MRRSQGVSVRCLIVDDNQSFLDAARALLEHGGLTVVGVANTSEDAVRLVEATRPDIVLVDVFLGDESGFDLARTLLDEAPQDGRRVILISTSSEDELEELIATSPAHGFLPKRDLSADAIRRLVDGDVA